MTSPTLSASSTFFDLVSALKTGARVDVEFKEDVEPWAGYLDAGMRGRVRDGRVLNDTVVELDVELTPYRRHNVAHERADYVDSEGQAGLTATEAGETVARVTVSVEGATLLVESSLLTVLPEWSVAAHERYQASHSPLTYTLWLEAELRDAQALARP